MQEFLIDVQTSRSADFGALAKILVDRAKSKDEGTRLTAIRWLKDFVGLAREQLMPQWAAILGAALPCISHPNNDIAQASTSHPWCIGHPDNGIAQAGASCRPTTRPSPRAGP